MNVRNFLKSLTQGMMAVVVISVLVTGLLLLTGCAGPRGADGSPGADGAIGAPGQSCSVSQATDGSGALIACPGSSVFVSNGAKGDKGDAGSAGANGTNATTVSMIKLCPTVTGSYGNFPEYAFQVGTTLYGVMGSALVPLFPGAYVTTTPQGANCSFTVHADGSHTN